MRSRAFSWPFIDNSIVLFSRDDHGFTPLLWASREGQTAVFDLLLLRGARVTAVNDGGDNGLHLAASKSNKEIIQRVRENVMLNTTLI